MKLNDTNKIMLAKECRDLLNSKSVIAAMKLLQIMMLIVTT